MSIALDPNALYITPTGRRCRWLPLGGPQHRWTAWAHFQYVSDQLQALGDGFVLTAKNYGILRKEASDATPR